MRPLTALEKDLEKVTNFRDAAEKGGLLRPFLYLVSLPPVDFFLIFFSISYTRCLRPHTVDA